MAEREGRRGQPACLPVSLRRTSHVYGGATESLNYSYDSLNRLSSASGSGLGSLVPAWSEAYTYDGFGNLTDKSSTGGAPTLTVAVYHSNNQIVGETYDANGNTIYGPGSSYGEGAVYYAWMEAASYNTGYQGQINRFKAGESPDYHTSPMGHGKYRNNYGINVLDLLMRFY
jgi:YD repeat-containing protein